MLKDRPPAFPRLPAQLQGAAAYIRSGWPARPVRWPWAVPCLVGTLAPLPPTVAPHYVVPLPLLAPPLAPPPAEAPVSPCAPQFPLCPAVACGQRVQCPFQSQGGLFIYFPVGTGANDHQLPRYKKSGFRNLLMPIPHVEQPGCPACAAQNRRPLSRAVSDPAAQEAGL